MQREFTPRITLFFTKPSEGTFALQVHESRSRLQNISFQPHTDPNFVTQLEGAGDSKWILRDDIISYHQKD
jgi:hypothetical protein